MSKMTKRDHDEILLQVGLHVSHILDVAKE